MTPQPSPWPDRPRLPPPDSGPRERRPNDARTPDNAGTFALVPGGRAGATGAGTRVFGQDGAGVPGAAESGDAFGAAVYLVDGDGRAEPVAGAPGENSGAGGFWVFPGRTTAQGSYPVTAGTLGTTASRAGLGTAFPR
ncbi:hypothetical protein AB0950_03975 [Streptomyces sp. NPDC007189]|uniref:hypothetical protein n=1 Tax=Streptomyces sp. NPDC007189 TaxID=3154315 RepID=UPI003451D83C